MDKSIVVQRREGHYDEEAARTAFQRFGIVILREYLPRSTQPRMRSILEGRLAKLAGRKAILKDEATPDADFLPGDVLALRELEEFDSIFFRDEAITLIKGLLRTQELLYWGDSSVQTGEGARGFHKDNVDRNDGARDDWARDYELVRCGFYMQDHDRWSGGLKVRLGSHNIPDHLSGPIADMRSLYGDLVIWSMRLTHSGNNRKLRFAPGLALHPRLEAKLPAAVTVPEQMRRMAAFCSLGKPGSHVDRYIARMNEREKDYKPYFQFARNRSEAARLLEPHGVTLRVPNEYYGELDS